MHFPAILNRLILAIANHFGDRKSIGERLEIERKVTSEIRGVEQGKIDYLWELYPNIHERCSALIGHLSIMFALAVFIYKEVLKLHPLLSILSILDVLLFLGLLVLSLRTLRSFGLARDLEDAEDYTSEFYAEMTLKFSLVEMINTLSLYGMCYSGLLLLLLALCQ